MSEKLRLTCPCGYENWIRPDRLGQTVECGMCGADLAADEAAIGGHLEGADAAEPEDETAPESPTNPPHPQAVFDDNITLEERVDRARKKPRKPLSPFDADEDEELVRAPEVGVKKTAPMPGASRPKARSPFEADEPQAEQKPRGSGPFTMEAGSHTTEGRAYADVMDETRPKERRDRHVIVQTVSPHDAPSGEKCTECGRDIRGSWDRIETEKGVICYVCSNQAVQGVPERLKTPKPECRELSEKELVIEEPELREPEKEPWYRDTESPEFKRVMYAVAVLTLVLAGYFMFFDTGTTPDEPTTREVVSESAKKITPVTAMLMQAWYVFAFFLSAFFAIYVPLRMNETTPHGELLPDVLYIGAVCVPLSILYFFIEAVRNFVGQVSPQLYALLGLARVVIFVLVVTRFIHMRFGQIVMASVIYLVLNNFILRAVSVLLFRDVLGLI